MGKLTFKRGIHILDNKAQTEACEIKSVSPSELMCYPLQQHIGAPLSPVVQIGEAVKLGQVIADSDAPVSVPLHASVSGVVREIGLSLHPSGAKVPSVLIENDGKDTPFEPDLAQPVSESGLDTLVETVKKAGIVGMGGAGFPVCIKLSPPPEKKIMHVIINGAECEPYLTADHRLMLERPEEVLLGAFLVMQHFGLKKAYVAVEENKKDAISCLKSHLSSYPGLEVLTLAKKYPQGGEKQLIYAVTGREVPAGKLPMDIGCVVLNAGSASAIALAVTKGIPSYERIVTVSGDAVYSPGNFSVRIGTSFSDVVRAAGGTKENLGKIVMGGPMMGIACHSLDVPVLKGTSGILLFSKKRASVSGESTCIRCGQCASVCPINLQPFLLNSYGMAGDWAGCNKNYIFSCMECGCCSYVCPAKRQLVQSIRMSKQKTRNFLNNQI